jgi:uncharacterized protein involved in exopolysaccharide biosynthesis
LENKVNTQDTGIDIQKLLAKALQYWYWILASILLALVIAFLINRYTIPLFEVKSSVMVVKPVDQGASAAALLYGADVFQGSQELSNESILIKTKTLVKHTLQKLNFEVTHYQQGNIKLSEAYKGASPFTVTFDTSSVNIPYGVLFRFIPLGNNLYELNTDNQEWNNQFSGKQFLSEKTYTVNGFIFKAIIKNDTPTEEPNELLFRINHLDELANYYSSALNVSEMPGGASALVLKLSGTTPEKEKDFLNAHMQTYVEHNLNIKNTNAINTLNFIDEQLQQISDSLYYIESRLESFKKDNSRLSISSEGGKIATNIQDLEKEKAVLLVNDRYYNYLKRYLSSDLKEESIVVPSNFGINDPVLNHLIGELVKVQADIEVLRKNENQANPILSNELKIKQRQLAELRSNLLENIRSIESANNIALNDLNKRISESSGQLQKLPTAERKLINIQRLYSLSENLYVFLME